MLLDYIHSDMIVVDETSTTFQEAIAFAGKPLLEKGFIKESYIKAMIRVAETQKYIVICPHVAMPHARTEDGVIKSGISISKLKNPVFFDHPEHDPVRVVVVLAGKDHESHIGLLSELSEFLDNEENMKKLLKASTKEEIIKALS